jgi:hypothetical protein
VRDDVVQLAGDPPPLLGGGLRYASPLLAVQTLGATVKRARPRADRPAGESGHDREHDESRAPDGVPERADERIRQGGDDDGHGRQHGGEQRPAPVHNGRVERDDDDEREAPALRGTEGDGQADVPAEYQREHRHRPSLPPRQ